jgi:hypothetical protein
MKSVSSNAILIVPAPPVWTLTEFRSISATLVVPPIIGFDKPVVTFMTNPPEIAPINVITPASGFESPMPLSVITAPCPKPVFSIRNRKESANAAALNPTKAVTASASA